MLQSSFTLAHLTRRLVASWGERSTVVRATQRIVRSMIQWGVLRDTLVKGVYEAVAPRQKIGPFLGTVLVEALLVDAEETSLPLDHLVAHPGLFPFDLSVGTFDIRATGRFQTHRQGLDLDFIELQASRRKAGSSDLDR